MTISFFIPFAASTAAGRRIKETKRGRGTHSWRGREGGCIYSMTKLSESTARQGVPVSNSQIKQPLIKNPSLSSSQITFANSILSKHTFGAKTVAKHNPGLHFHSNNLNPEDSYRPSPRADFILFFWRPPAIIILLSSPPLSFSSYMWARVNRCPPNSITPPWR